MKQNTKLDQFIIFAFLLFISLPAIFGLIYTKHTNSEIENRRLNDLPVFPNNSKELKEFPQKYDKYYADHFGFRWSLFLAYRHIAYLLGDSPSKYSMFGKEQGWIFYNRKSDGDALGDYRNINQFTKEELSNYVRKIQKKQKWLKERGIEYLFVIAPSKHYIYPEKLPEYITRQDKQNIVAQLVQELSEHPEINFLELAPKLIASKGETLLYSKADSHWNYFGTNVAQFEIAKKIKKLFPDRIEPKFHSKDVFKESDYRGELALFMGLGEYFVENKSIPELASCAREYYPKKERYNQTFSTKCSKEGLSAIVFRDSFFSDLQPFMSLYFSNSQYIWRKMLYSQLEDYVQPEYPDIVIEELIDRHLH